MLILLIVCENKLINKLKIEVESAVILWKAILACLLS